ncbi:MAG: hypothetical protein EOP54_21775 [Sphingobacteriales bacterium]|nr:MAG: hypothetical protein EOP54_21775 [Sphingobacteriales bacterium]
MKHPYIYIPLYLLVFSCSLFSAGCGKLGNEEIRDPEMVNDTTVTDVEGNVYKAVKIGTQIWMAENLKVTKYRDGTPLPNVTGKEEWFALTSGAYCNYKNDPAVAAIYGKLYNWYAVTNTHQLTPKGWHIPTDAEWTVLYNYMGGTRYDGGKIQEKGTTHWSSDTGADNSTGFTGIPGQGRLDNIYYPWNGNIGSDGIWWSATESSSTNAWYMDLYVKGYFERHNDSKTNGYSVRCIKDQL